MIQPRLYRARELDYYRESQFEKNSEMSGPRAGPLSQLPTNDTSSMMRGVGLSESLRSVGHRFTTTFAPPLSDCSMHPSHLLNMVSAVLLRA